LASDSILKSVCARELNMWQEARRVHFKGSLAILTFPSQNGTNISITFLMKAQIALWRGYNFEAMNP
jgi:hypothetical protein